jgi:predicted acetyltransferase
MDVPSQQPLPRRARRQSSPGLNSSDSQLTTVASVVPTQATFANRKARPSNSHPNPVNPGPEVRLVSGHAGDHALVHALLRAANQAPSYEDFLTWLDEPTYEPTDRLLLKHGERIVAHVQLLTRSAWFDGVQVPVGALQDMALLPEYVQAGYEPLLVSAAVQALRSAQAAVAVVRSARAQPYRSAGWIDARGQGHSEVGINDLLAHLAAQPAPAPRRLRRLRIRRWRHVELDGVRNVYLSAGAPQWGALYRADAYWQWLIGRNAHSDLIVAVEGEDDWEQEKPNSRIVGYVVMQSANVLELFCLQEFARIAPRMLVRACQDAIEHDNHALALYTPASDPLHELVVTAGGSWCAADHRVGAALLVKLLDPAHWIEAIYPLLRRRAKRSGLARPLQMCFDTGDEQFRLVITRRSSRLVADEMTRADVHCDKATFAALLLSNLNIAKARAAGRLTVTDDETLHRLSALFPPCLFWQSQFDWLRF